MRHVLRRIGFAWIVMVLFTTALADNPLAKPVEQRPFAGAFTGENISLEMNYDAAQEAYTGWLTFNGKRYACGGWVNNSQLSGQFVADGEKYPFSIGINGNDITLTSAGTNYAMKRKAAPAAAGGNPLGGGGAAPANPLGGGGGGPAGGGGAPAVNPNPAPPANGNAPGGVGIMFQQNADGELIIGQILPGSPAANAGLKAGLYLMAVDGKSTEKLSPEQLRALIVGPIGSKVTLTVEDDNDKSQDVALTRADIGALMNNLRNNQGPGPNGGGGAMPPGPNGGGGGGGGQDRPIGGGGTLPPGPNFGPGGNNNQAPAWMKPGVRLTYWGGSALIPGTNTVLVPDDNGEWKTPDGRSYSPSDNPGGGGMGYQQLTIASMDNGIAVVDARNFLLDPQTKNCTTVGVTGYILPVNNGGDYWGDPAQLAQMQAGDHGAVHIFRGPYKLGNQTYNVVRITTKVSGGYSQTTYDVDSGICVSLGSCTTGAAQMTPGPNGVGGTGDGNTHMVQCFFVGMRQTNLPWTGQHASQELARLRQLDFSGSYTTVVQSASTISWPYTSRWEINKIDETSVQLRQTYAIDYQNGQQPQPVTSDRAGSLATLWIDPRILGNMQAGQVLDEDPLTKFRLSVDRVQDGVVVLAEKAQVENSAIAFDSRSGVVAGMQMQQQNGMGTTTISVKRTQ